MVDDYRVVPSTEVTQKVSPSSYTPLPGGPWHTGDKVSPPVGWARGEKVTRRATRSGCHVPAGSDRGGDTAGPPGGAPVTQTVCDRAETAVTRPAWAGDTPGVRRVSVRRQRSVSVSGQTL